MVITTSRIREETHFTCNIERIEEITCNSNIQSIIDGRGSNLTYNNEVKITSLSFWLLNHNSKVVPNLLFVKIDV